jgi:hypothetical protein
MQVLRFAPERRCVSELALESSFQAAPRGGSESGFAARPDSRRSCRNPAVTKAAGPLPCKVADHLSTERRERL